MQELGFIGELTSEISNISIPNLITVVLLFYVAYRFSKGAETLFFHLLYSFFGIYMLMTMESFGSIYNTKMLVGLGLLIPQISFIKYFINDTLQTVKMMSANTYYFFVTIYYKILRLINWIASTFRMFKIFFTTFSFKKEDYQEYEQSSYHENTHDTRGSRFYEEKKQSYSEQERNNYYSKSNSSKEKTNNSHHSKKSYFKQKKKEQGQYQEKIEKEANYGRFSDDSVYVVLGVNPSDDFKTIKKVYRKLVREYHPDLNPNEIEKYTEITQLINSAYEKLEKYKR